MPSKIEIGEWTMIGFHGTQFLAYPVIPELEILESRDMGKEFKDVPILERI